MNVVTELACAVVHGIFLSMCFLVSYVRCVIVRNMTCPTLPFVTSVEVGRENEDTIAYSIPPRLAILLNKFTTACYAHLSTSILMYSMGTSYHRCSKKKSRLLPAPTRTLLGRR
jgi:hypothetical protein